MMGLGSEPLLLFEQRGLLGDLAGQGGWVTSEGPLDGWKQREGGSWVTEGKRGREQAALGARGPFAHPAGVT